MSKIIILCPKCNTPLKFRKWSKRDGEALADCTKCNEKWQVRLYKGIPTCRPYQVRPPAKKIARGSYKVEPGRKAQIEAIYGSIQSYIDTGILVGMPLQSKTSWKASL